MEAMLRDGWIKEGDLNTSYFQKIVDDMHKKNLFNSIAIDGASFTESALIVEGVSCFFKSHFSKSSPSLVFCDWDSLSLPYFWREEIDNPFSKGEIKEVVFNMRGDETPGPDGFPILFL